MTTLTERLESLIAEQSLKPGDRLPSERSLASDFGVSRSSLREAISQLVSRGLLVSRQGGGTFVAEPKLVEPISALLLPIVPLTRSEAGYWQDVMEMRRLIEGDTAFFAATRANEQDKHRLQTVFESMISTSPSDTAAQAKIDAAFHLAIAQASHNAVLYQVMSGLLSLLELSISKSLRDLYHLSDINDELNQHHRKIVEAIIEQRPEDARRAALEHLDCIEEQLRTLEESVARERRSSRAMAQIAQCK